MSSTPQNPNTKGGGRGRPPVKHQFQKGQSGNPKGRPRKSRDLRKMVDEELDQLVPMTRNGKRVRVTKREILVSMLVNGAVRGEDKPLQALLKLLGSAAPEPDPVVSVDPAELARFALRYLPAGQRKDSGEQSVDSSEDGEAEQ